MGKWRSILSFHCSVLFLLPQNQATLTRWTYPVMGLKLRRLPTVILWECLVVAPYGFHHWSMRLRMKSTVHCHIISGLMEMMAVIHWLSNYGGYPVFTSKDYYFHFVEAWTLRVGSNFLSRVTNTLMWMRESLTPTLSPWFSMGGVIPCARISSWAEN